MHIFYTPSIEEQDSHFTLSEEESKHSIRVLRLAEGDQIKLVDGKGGEYISEIVVAHPKRTQIKVNSFIKQERSRSYKLHLVVAPTKNIERFEWFLEKATEIGIDEITPLICEHSERKELKVERLNKIIVSAMKQSQQYYIPKIHPPVKFSDFINREFSCQTYIAHCADGEKQFINATLSPGQDALILIGPEGDFSLHEIMQAIGNGFKPVSLGSTRLRTETAAVVACLEVNLINRYH